MCHSISLGASADKKLFIGFTLLLYRQLQGRVNITHDIVVCDEPATTIARANYACAFGTALLNAQTSNYIKFLIGVNFHGDLHLDVSRC